MPAKKRPRLERPDIIIVFWRWPRDFYDKKNEKNTRDRGYPLWQMKGDRQEKIKSIGNVHATRSKRRRK